MRVESLAFDIIVCLGVVNWCSYQFIGDFIVVIYCYDTQFDSFLEQDSLKFMFLFLYIYCNIGLYFVFMFKF